LRPHGTARIVGAVELLDRITFERDESRGVAGLAYQQNRVRFVLVKQNMINFQIQSVISSKIAG
jgi:hypothetical protein